MVSQSGMGIQFSETRLDDLKMGIQKFSASVDS